MLLHASLLVLGEQSPSPDASAERTCPASAAGGLDCLAARLDNSWLAQLEPDPESTPPNKRARQVHSGHYVPVKPTPLRRPYLVACSPSVLALLELDEAECVGGGGSGGGGVESRFVRLFSGATDAVAGFESSWATPYALSIYGDEVQPNGAGSKGNGYGDGRAISIGEVLTSAGARWELQLKGAGTTPFCRNADGRAVLRSSVREYLASEAMHHMGVPTTRALSLVGAAGETVQRPWYSTTTYGGDANASTSCDDTDARCVLWAGAGECERNAAYMESRCAKSCAKCNAKWSGRSRGAMHGGDVHQHERCAITTRVSRSFLRVGHFELYGRRARSGPSASTSNGLRNLEQLARHALWREYPPYDAEAPLQPQLLRMAKEAAVRFAEMAAAWVRVGYAQSNFNSDNCLISGVTVDYGPFGFVEPFSPRWSMWVGSAEGGHFGFLNQPRAAGRNYRMFAQALLPLLDRSGARELRAAIDGYDGVADSAMARMWSAKLGLTAGARASELAAELLGLMEHHGGVDYTLLWRQLAAALERGNGAAGASEDEAALIAGVADVLAPSLYEPLSDAQADAWRAWLRRWLHAHREEALSGDGRGGGGGGGGSDGDGDGDGDAAVVAAEAERRARAMRLVSPKYVPREWMLAEAYKGAEQGNHTAVHTLQRLFSRPFDEQLEFEELYYRRQPVGAAQQGGIGFMS